MPYALKWKRDNTYLAAVTRGVDGYDVWTWTVKRSERILFLLKRDAQRMARAHSSGKRIAIVRVK